MIFTIIASGYRPRCALDSSDGAEVRVMKIAAVLRIQRLDSLENLWHNDLLWAIGDWIDKRAVQLADDLAA